MEDFIKFIPNSVISLIGIAVLMGILIMLGTMFQEWAKSLYRRSILGGKEKRQSKRQDYDGIERRDENKELHVSLAALMDSMTESNREMKEFVKAINMAHQETADQVEKIARVQDKNWKRLFDEELPSIRT